MATDRANYEAAANRLHHLSMRYAGAVVELATGKPVGVIHHSRPGLHEVRDLVDLILLTRAGINAIVKIMADSGVCTGDEFLREATEQYNWLTAQKAAKMGCEVTDLGLVFKSKGS